jgi:hypothetical protein
MVFSVFARGKIRYPYIKKNGDVKHFSPRDIARFACKPDNCSLRVLQAGAAFSCECIAHECAPAGAANGIT